MQDVLLKKAEKERARMVRKGDDWKVGESRAVSAVRSAALDAGVEGEGGGSVTTTPNRRRWGWEIRARVEKRET
jgi:hypothetical protein